MTKHDKRKRKKAEKASRNAQLGYCHGCGAPWTKLTYEHVPPARVQGLIPEKYIRFNPFETAISQPESKSNSKTQLPPCTVAHGGLKVKSFGECCQQLTQQYYGQAFFDWSRLILEICEKLPDNEDRIQAVVEIQPLGVIKQIAAMALAASEFNNNKNLAQLRSFIQNPEQLGLPAEFDFYAYLNPIRPNYALPQCRLTRKTMVISNIEDKTRAMVLTEVSVPPLGYVILYRSDNLNATAQSLMSLNQFAGIPLNHPHAVALDIPIRTPFGPFPLRYMQDAEKEPRKIESSAVR
jgi:hypothetical protein